MSGEISRENFPMNTSSEKFDPIGDLRRRKANFRNYVRDLSPTQKILELEALQERFYELMKVREENGGLPVPDGWRRWHKAQSTIKR